MGTIDDVSQKIKGKAQQLKGEFEDNTGNEGQGMWDKVKGKINEGVADFKLDSNRHHNAD